MAIRSMNDTAGLTTVEDPVFPANSTVLHVGADKEFKTVGAAVAAARDGYVILVDAGTYTNDFATVRAKLTILGVGGMVNMVATVPPPDQKAIMTVDNDLTLKNFSFSGCAVSQQSGANGAGIRYEAGRMVLVNDAFLGNQNGVMGGAGTLGYASEVVIDHCLFSGNGGGTGNTHNLYIGDITSLTVTNSIFEKANVGHELKSRAEANTITGNIFRNGPTGTASYDIDLPNGGVDVVTDNVIEKGPLAQNNAMVHFGGEGLPYLGSSLLLQGNLFVNDLGPQAIAVLNHSGLPVSITGNTFSNIAAAKVASGPAALTGNVTADGAPIADSSVSEILPGNTVTFTDASAHSVLLNGMPQAVQGGAGLLTVTVTASQATTVGSTGGLDYTEVEGTADNKVTTLAGTTNTLRIVSRDLVDSRGTDTITTGTGDVTGTLSGTATVTDGSGYDKWTVTGTASFSSNAMGYPFVAVSATGKASITGPLSGFNVQNNGGFASIDMTGPGATDGSTSHYALTMQGGSALAVLNPGVVGITTAFGAQGAVLHLTDGAVQVVSNGNDVVWAGAGSDSVIARGHTEVHAGTGALTVYGNGTTAKVYANGGTTSLAGNSGGLTYYGGDTANTVVSDLSHDTLIGGAGHMTVVGIGYNEQVIGGSGGISYSMPTGSGTVTTAAGSVNDIRLNIGSVDSWGQDTIAFGANNVSATIHGDSTITGSTATEYLTLSGRDTLNGRGRDGLTVTSGANVTINVGVAANITATSAKMRLSLGSGATASTASVDGSAWVDASQANGLAIQTMAKTSSNVVLGTGATRLITGGADVVHGGSGTSFVDIIAPNAHIWGGSGEMTIRNDDFKGGDTLNVHGGTGKMTVFNIGDRINFYGGAGDAVIYGNGGTLNLVGGSGNLTTTGGGAGLRFLGGSGTASLTLNPGSITTNDIIFGKGTTTVQAEQWGKGTLFEFMAGQGGGTDIINGFRVGADRLMMHGVGVQTQATNAAGTSLVLTDGTHVQLNGVMDASKLFA